MSRLPKFMLHCNLVTGAICYLALAYAIATALGTLPALEAGLVVGTGVGLQMAAWVASSGKLEGVAIAFTITLGLLHDLKAIAAVVNLILLTDALRSGTKALHPLNLVDHVVALVIFGMAYLWAPGLRSLAAAP